MLLMTMPAADVPRIAAEATQRPRMRSVMPTSRGRGFVSHGPLGCFVVTLVIWPAGNGGRWFGMVTSHTVAGFGSSGSDVADVTRSRNTFDVKAVPTRST